MVTRVSSNASSGGALSASRCELRAHVSELSLGLWIAYPQDLAVEARWTAGMG